MIVEVTQEISQSESSLHKSIVSRLTMIKVAESLVAPDQDVTEFYTYALRHFNLALLETHL